LGGQTSSVDTDVHTCCSECAQLQLTSSAIYGHGKGVVVKRLRRIDFVTHASEVMGDADAAADDIAAVGIKLMVAVYGGSTEDRLSAYTCGTSHTVAKSVSLQQV